MGTGIALISMISSHVVCSFDKFSDRSGSIETCTSAAVEALLCTVESLLDREDVCLLTVLLSFVRILIVAATTIHTPTLSQPHHK